MREGGRREGGWEGGGGKKGRREREGGQRCSASVVARAIVKVNQGVAVGASHALARLAVPTGCPLKVESHQKGSDYVSLHVKGASRDVERRSISGPTVCSCYMWSTP